MIQLECTLPSNSPALYENACLNSRANETGQTSCGPARFVVQAACPAKLAERSGVSPAQLAGWKPASQHIIPARRQATIESNHLVVV
jgi:hypothetical protein